MKITHLLAGLFAVLLAGNAVAADLSDAKHKQLDGVLQSVFDAMKGDPAHLDGLVRALDDAFAHSAYGKDPGSNEVRQRLTADASHLKLELITLEKDIAKLRSIDQAPSAMTFLLSREQSVGFAIYKWLRTIVELTDLANFSVGRSDATAAELSAGMIKLYEEQQDTLGVAIQAVAIQVMDSPP